MAGWRAGWLAHAFWIARQIYAPPLVCAGTGNGQRLRLASLGSVRFVGLPASVCLCVHVCASVCVCVCCLLVGFYQPFEGCLSLCVCVCLCAALLKMLWQISVCIIRFKSAQHVQQRKGKWKGDWHFQGGLKAGNEIFMLAQFLQLTVSPAIKQSK